MFYAGNPPAIEALSAKNLMSPVAPTTLSLVPATDNSAQGTWVGVSARSGALIYNTNTLTATKLPASVLELATPAWKGRFAFAPTETDFTPIVTAAPRRTPGQRLNDLGFSGSRSGPANTPASLMPLTESLHGVGPFWVRSLT